MGHSLSSPPYRISLCDGRCSNVDKNCQNQPIRGYTRIQHTGRNTHLLKILTSVPAPLSPVPLYFSSLSLLRTALHYPNAWNRLILSGSRNKRWLHTYDACVITPWRLGLRAPLVDRNKLSFFKLIDQYAYLCACMSPHARESSIREIFTCRIWNPRLWNLKYTSRNPESHQRQKFY